LKKGNDCNMEMTSSWTSYLP